LSTVEITNDADLRVTQGNLLEQILKTPWPSLALYEL